jgi:hypothetical protein
MGIGVMNRFNALLIISLMSGSVMPEDSFVPVPTQGPLAASASREVSRLVRSTVPASGTAQKARRRPNDRGWIARHSKLVGAFVGFGVGCGIGAARVGGSGDDFFNALDEFACPVVGGIGAAVGAVIGSLVK